MGYFKKNFFTYLGLVLALIGLIDSYYITTSLEKNSLRCDLNGFNCINILTSQYGKFLGIPLSIWGIIYYLTLTILFLLLLFKYFKYLNKVLTGLIISGFIVSFVLLVIQTFILKSFCSYCLASDFTNIVLLVLLILYNLFNKNLIKDKKDK